MGHAKNTPADGITKTTGAPPAELTGRALAEAMRHALQTTLSTQEAAVHFLYGAGIVSKKGKLTKHYR